MEESKLYQKAMEPCTVTHEEILRIYRQAIDHFKACRRDSNLYLGSRLYDIAVNTMGFNKHKVSPCGLIIPVVERTTLTYEDCLEREMKIKAAIEHLNTTIKNMRGIADKGAKETQGHPSIHYLEAGKNMVKTRSGEKFLLVDFERKQNGGLEVTLANLEKRQCLVLDEYCLDLKGDKRYPKDIVEVKKICPEAFVDGYDSDAHGIVWREVGPKDCNGNELEEGDLIFSLHPDRDFWHYGVVTMKQNRLVAVTAFEDEQVLKDNKAHGHIQLKEKARSK